MAEDQEETQFTPDVHFEPIVKLPLVELKTLEEDEEVLFKMRAKLFRYDTSEETAEWKERGTGEIKILKHSSEDYVRILMRRDKTLKICANHYIQPYMELKPNSTSDRAWIWNTLADFADEEPKPELLAIKFANAENAQKFKAAFEEAKKLLADKEQDNESQKSSGDEEEDESKQLDDGDSKDPDTTKEGENADIMSEKLSELSVQDTNTVKEEEEDKTKSSDTGSPKNVEN